MLSGGEGPPRLKLPGGEGVRLLPDVGESSPPPLEESSLCLSCPIAFAIGLLLNFSNVSLALTLSLTAFQTVERPEGLDSDVAGLVLREVGLPDEAVEFIATPDEGSFIEGE